MVHRALKTYTKKLLLESVKYQPAIDSLRASVAVLDEWQGRGVARLLTAVLLLEAQQQGIDCFQAETLRENDDAVEFITSIGGRSVAGDGYTRSFRLDIAEALATLRQSPGLASFDALLA